MPSDQCQCHGSHLLSQHEIGQLLDEEMDEQERAELAEAEAVCREFLAWDLAGDTETDGGCDDEIERDIGKR